jgi:ligand-binding sensor domain-containing protein
MEHARAVPLEGAGAAFALAATRTGVAVGYGQGVFLPERRLLSAFHGLPGNQAYALATSREGERLWVGTPTGLGWIDGGRVTGRVVPGEGKLPHPWVTALIAAGEDLLVATYGGGVARRTDADRWEVFPETAGLKVNAGAAVLDPSSRLWIGTQGQGVWRSDRGVRRFERVPMPLPSPDVFALTLVPAEAPRSLLVATDQGLLRLPYSSSPEAP